MSKVIIVTGASRGIGRNIAYNLAVNGYRVIANYNNSETEAQKLKQQIEVLKRKQKSLENEGKIQQSIDLAIEISKITRMLKDY